MSGMLGGIECRAVRRNRAERPLIAARHVASDRPGRQLARPKLSEERRLSRAAAALADRPTRPQSRVEEASPSRGDPVVALALERLNALAGELTHAHPGASIAERGASPRH